MEELTHIQETLEERLRTKHLTLTRDKTVADRLAKLCRQHLIRRDTSGEIGPDNRGEQDILVITGLSGAGKSYTVDHVLKEVAHPFDPSRKLADCTISVVLPSPFTTKSLAIALIKKIDGNSIDVDKLTDAELWGLVVTRLEQRKILFVRLDEFQRFKTERGINSAAQRVESIRRLAETVNYLVTEDRWPVSLVISGLPELLTFWDLQVLSQVKRRTKFIDFAQMTEEHDGVFSQVVEEYCSMAGISWLTEGRLETVARLRVASGATIGIAIEIAQEAVVEAVERSSTLLEPRDFASVFAGRHPKLVSNNPFVVHSYRQWVMPGPSELSEVFVGEIRNQPAEEPPSRRKPPKGG